MAVSKNTGGAKTVDTTKVPLSDVPGKPDTAGITADNLEPATYVAASGALIEPTIVDRIDTSHPAVDNEPRKGASVESNQIDFNDPTLTLSEQVEQNLVQRNLQAAEKKAD
ncbi:MAG TPA: hypothetical protein VGN68_04445 [Sphingopyxis sp.]|jgi:hypothetical protein|uniref:hypothetical protein n=1 Tax=Sphingopyxis sp. TaxID=1908224 RepID=UPI002E153F9A|nr:hypothetical protein [Sphingopyxis sp.]